MKPDPDDIVKLSVGHHFQQNLRNHTGGKRLIFFQKVELDFPFSKQKDFAS